MRPIISVENLSKRYYIGRNVATEGLRHRLERALTKPFKRHEAQGMEHTAEGIRHTDSGPDTEFWALKDVSFEVQQGEVVGIIGRNGAGKSTLLKVLSRITEPTKGRVTIDGRVASLLEVGTGFHPELTGRENVYLNGAILGMTKREIRSKFDEIVAFAEIDKFIDTPVKRYSSGMYVRLAFAVAAHLEPEILIVDEVLAVGDAEFQRRCLGKMHNVASSGRTVLFVSHQMPAVKSLCNKAIWLSGGSIKEEGASSEIIAHYLAASADATQPSDLAHVSHREGSGAVQFSSLECLDSQGKSGFDLRSGDSCTFVATLCNRTGNSYTDCSYSLDFYDEFGNRLLLCRSDLIKRSINITGGQCVVQTTFRELPLAPGRYRLSVYLGRDGGEFYDYIESAATLDVREGDFFGTGHPGHSSLCRVLSHFEMSVLPN